MSGTTRRPARRMTVVGVIAGAIVLHVAALILFHAEPVGEEERKAQAAEVKLLPMGGVETTSAPLREQALLFDSTPLFLPTRWNAVSNPVVRGLSRRPGDLFPAYSPELSLENIEIGSTRMDASATAPIDGVREFDAAPFHAFRGVPARAVRLSGRTAHFQVLAAASGEEVFSVDIDDSLPDGGQLWGPAVFGVQITPLGLTGSPVLLEGSGIEEIDAFFSRQLRDRILTGRLPEPGYYRVLVGP